MSDSTFRPRKITPSDLPPAPQPVDLAQRAAFQREAGVETPEPYDTPAPTPDFSQAPEIKGNITPEMLSLMRQGAEAAGPAKGPQVRPAVAAPPSGVAGVLQEMMAEIRSATQQYEAVTLPSLGKFYDGKNGPVDGVVHIRPMTGNEEKILATPRHVKKGTAVNMIFRNCLKESFDPDALLTIDRTYLLIYLRGISYTTEYEVQVRCTECQEQFTDTIDLDTLWVDQCPENFDPESMVGRLPKTGFKFGYRLSTGGDEARITTHREKRIKDWGDKQDDDTLLYRASLLIQYVESPSGQVLEGQGNILSLLEQLPIQDVAYIRNLLTEPPFGVDTQVKMACPSCSQTFATELPLGSNFFFPRTRKAPVDRA
jgi:hypothetical protein